MLKDVFVRACGWGVFPGVGFMVMGSGCLCRRLVVVRGGLASGALASRGTSLLNVLKFTAMDQAYAERGLTLVSQAVFFCRIRKAAYVMFSQL